MAGSGEQVRGVDHAQVVRLRYARRAFADLEEIPDDIAVESTWEHAGCKLAFR
jgi:hypothetical protein